MSDLPAPLAPRRRRDLFADVLVLVGLGLLLVAAWRTDLELFMALVGLTSLAAGVVRT